MGMREWKRVATSRRPAAHLAPVHPATKQVATVGTLIVFQSTSGTSMLTGPLPSQIDKIWDAFWSGGISNPPEVM
jgi:hypothetical protein